ncbi:hypothetical protein RJ55_02244 [Drechmeria coniospora]|nr:hypothetical protein RJ55_02244 [Drechmeria coniospora]
MGDGDKGPARDWPPPARGLQTLFFWPTWFQHAKPCFFNSGPRPSISTPLVPVPSPLPPQPVVFLFSPFLIPAARSAPAARRELGPWEIRPATTHDAHAALDGSVHLAPSSISPPLHRPAPQGALANALGFVPVRLLPRPIVRLRPSAVPPTVAAAWSGCPRARCRHRRPVRPPSVHRAHARACV